MMNSKMKKEERSLLEICLAQMKSFLESYKTCQKICSSYKLECRAGLIPISEAEQREQIYKECYQRCMQVEAFIDSLFIEPEKKKMLELHYINGYTIEKCADQMYLSRSTAFRIKKKAELSACAVYLKLKNEQIGEQHCVDISSNFDFLKKRA